MDLWRLDAEGGSSISVRPPNWSGDVRDLGGLTEIEIDTPLRSLKCRGRRLSTHSLTCLMEWLVDLERTSIGELRQPIFIDKELGLSMMRLSVDGPIQSIEAALGPLAEEEFWDSVVLVLNVHSDELGKLLGRVSSLLLAPDSIETTSRGEP